MISEDRAETTVEAHRIWSRRTPGFTIGGLFVSLGNTVSGRKASGWLFPSAAEIDLPIVFVFDETKHPPVFDL